MSGRVHQVGGAVKAHCSVESLIPETREQQGVGAGEPIRPVGAAMGLILLAFGAEAFDRAKAHNKTGGPLTGWDLTSRSRGSPRPYSMCLGW